MATKEEIENGLKNILATYHNQVPFADEVPEILRFLDSKGVVIKAKIGLTGIVSTVSVM